MSDQPLIIHLRKQDRVACGHVAPASVAARPSRVTCGSCIRTVYFQARIEIERALVAANLLAVREESKSQTFAVVTGLSQQVLCGRCGMARCEHATLSVSS